MAGRKFFVGGNFKMNGTHESLVELVKVLNDSHLDPNTDIIIAPPSLYRSVAFLPLMSIRDQCKKQILVAAQNGYLEKSGAFTGEISFHQLADENIPYVILGHSERRALFHESSSFVGLKTASALKFGLSVIACVGESLSDRESSQTSSVVRSQLEGIKEGLEKEGQGWEKVVIAYEPVWAIGTGKVATPDQAQEVHEDIRKWLAESVSEEVAEKTRIIYGGSVNGKNSGELAREKDIDGFLVGGASLKPEFVDIVNSGSKLRSKV